MKKKYAYHECDKSQGFEKGKRYEIISECPFSIVLKSDFGINFLCLKQNCSFINGGSWQFEEVEENKVVQITIGELCLN